jgi:hypothetical protein
MFLHGAANTGELVTSVRAATFAGFAGLIANCGF